MADACRELKGFALIVNGYYDHAHLLVRIPGKIVVSALQAFDRLTNSPPVARATG